MYQKVRKGVDWCLVYQVLCTCCILRIPSNHQFPNVFYIFCIPCALIFLPSFLPSFLPPLLFNVCYWDSGKSIITGKIWDSTYTIMIAMYKPSYYFLRCRTFFEDCWVCALPLIAWGGWHQEKEFCTTNHWGRLSPTRAVHTCVLL